ncbi:S-ribosylhomocysteine lyase [Terrisporobacter mayombei]|uniref:S-ribosylhomocysteine lyase n=2 Tax=Peptostreptococcaceae TaxID=186804 RepID=A0ABY9Q390_9FIRM|nr:S-ribosylhomocysteine lyase [Terrisporobacter mayombei]MCC3870056.1 S-ribosylhomocysteine lyase [Terrisporobacter mayombei]WMT82448.1 S-ribosylhomocysteine lyase [Terrisporobacter mayombei]
MEKVESFKLDHNKVKAPYVRKCCVLDGKMGDKVSKFDLRFLQPNIEAFGTAAIHGLEHLLATYLREELEDIIDLSPMGCRTGFYLIMWGDIEPSLVKSGLERALQKVIDSKEMVAASAVECGNYRDLSLFGTQEYAKKALKEGFSLSIYGK